MNLSTPNSQSFDSSNFPQVPWGWRDLLGAIVIAGIGIVLLNIAVLILGLLLNIQLRESALLMLIAIPQDVIIIRAAWTFSGLRHNVGWDRLGLRSYDVAFGCLFSAALFGLSFFIRICYVIIAQMWGVDLKPQDILMSLDVTGWGFVLTFFAVALLAPVAEEIFFRGFLYGGLRARIGVIGAMIASTFFFTALHFSIDAFIPIFVLGLFLAWLYEKTGSLYPGIILHAANNGVAVIALFIAQMLGVKLT